MISRNLMGNRNVAAGEEFAEQVTQFRSRYDGLLNMLANCGTEVARQRTLETDLDIKPYQFVRLALHRYIFPPQPDVELTDTGKSGVVEGTQPYTLRHEAYEASYDESMVEGILEVRYDDSGNYPHLTTAEVSTDKSQFPAEVLEALDLAFIESSTATH